MNRGAVRGWRVRRERIGFVAALCVGAALSAAWTRAVWAGGSRGEATQSGRDLLKRPIRDLLPEADEAARERAAERGKLLDLVDRARTRGDRAAAHLALANWELSAGAGVSATRHMLGLDDQADRAAMVRAATAAQEHLEAAGELLDADGDDGDAADRIDDEQRERWASALEALSAFGQTFEALAVGGSADRDAQASPPSTSDDSPAADTPAAKACRRAALQLSIQRESSNPDLSSAARLWQAQALYLGRRPDRALAALGPPLLPPKRWPYDFFSRILRCRIIGEDGGDAAAIAILIRMEKQTADWLSRDKDEARRARNTVTVARLRAMRHWADRLRREHDPDHADQVETRLIKLRSARFGGDASPELYSLAPTVPILVEPPAIRPPEPPGTRATEPAAPTSTAPESAPATPTVSTAPATSTAPAPTSTAPAATAIPSADDELADD